MAGENVLGVPFVGNQFAFSDFELADVPSQSTGFLVTASFTAPILPPLNVGGSFSVAGNGDAFSGPAADAVAGPSFAAGLTFGGSPSNFLNETSTLVGAGIVFGFTPDFSTVFLGIGSPQIGTSYGNYIGNVVTFAQQYLNSNIQTQDGIVASSFNALNSPNNIVASEFNAANQTAPSIFDSVNGPSSFSTAQEFVNGTPPGQIGTLLEGAQQVVNGDPSSLFSGGDGSGINGGGSGAAGQGNSSGGINVLPPIEVTPGDQGLNTQGLSDSVLNANAMMLPSEVSPDASATNGAQPVGAVEQSAPQAATFDPSVNNNYQDAVQQAADLIDATNQTIADGFLGNNNGGSNNNNFGSGNFGSGNFGGLPIDAMMKANSASPRCGLLVIDLRNGDIVQWFRFRGDITELFDVGVIANIRCPRGSGPYAPGLEEAMRGEELAR